MKRRRRTQRSVLRWVRRGLGALVALILAAIAGAAAYLWLALPQTTGTLRLAGLSAPVEITRDAHGVPRIAALSENDSWFAVGFVHAQDRLFQMELMRRTGRGRLAETIGAGLIDTDRFLRTLGLLPQAEASLAALSPAARAQLDAYAAGVNAWLAQGKALPPEFAVLRIAPEPWQPVDSLLWAGLMRLQLAGNWRDELTRARLVDRIAPALMDELWPERPADAATTLAALAPLYRGLDLDRVAASLPAPLGPNQASNEWVVSGARTASGKPILVNDPHLLLGAPGTWYLARIDAPGLSLTGASTPGVPAIVVGRNARIAWGFTTTNADTYDLFVERADPADPGRYLTPDGSQPFETRQEIIKVRGGADVTIVVRATRHGPVISDARRPLGAPDEGDILALSSPAVYRADRTPEALFALGRAQSWADFTAAVRDWGAPVQNAVYADVDGNIGFAAAGTVPLRKSGQGWALQPGWTGEADWTGLAASETMPRGFNPPSGRFVNSNNRIVADDFPVFLGRDWDSPYRGLRLLERIEGAAKIDRDTAENILADHVSLFARAVLMRLDRVAPAGERDARALQLLRGWDGAMDRNRPEPLIFNAWMRNLSIGLLREAAPGVLDDIARERPELLLRAFDGQSAFCRDRAGGCAASLAAGLTVALDDLSRRLGADTARWRWGDMHYAPFGNQVFERIPLLRDVLGFHVETDGDYYTVNRGASRLSDASAPFAHILGAGYRAVYDLSDPDASLFVAVPGQSGLPQSSHWGDLAALWAAGRHFPIRRGDPGDRLTLTPQ